MLTGKRDKRFFTAEQFAVMLRDHEMTIKHDDGLYRHLYCRSTKHCFDWFDIVTWPGSLSFSGDLGSYTFSRTDDMLGFFAGKDGRDLPFDYWAEKAVAVDRHSGMKTHSKRALLRVVVDRAKDMISDLEDGDRKRRREITHAAKELIEQIRNCDTWAGMLNAFREFDQAGLRFDDCESIPDPVLVQRFYLACRCINWAANRYLEIKKLEGLAC